MSIFDLFRKKPAKAGTPAPARKDPPDEDLPFNKDALFQMVFREMAFLSPSSLFVSGPVFDIIRQKHEHFAQILRSRDVMGLQRFLIEAYLEFCREPGRFSSQAQSGLSIENSDTDPRRWNTDLMALPSGEPVALCYMPVQSDTSDAQILGVALGQEQDGCYFCTLAKDVSAPSDVMRSNGGSTVQKVGEVNGRGFELMNAFLAVIGADMSR